MLIAYYTVKLYKHRLQTDLIAARNENSIKTFKRGSKLLKARNVEINEWQLEAGL